MSERQDRWDRRYVGLALAGGAPLLALDLAQSDERQLLDALLVELLRAPRLDPLQAAAALDRAVKAEKRPAALKRVIEWALGFERNAAEVLERAASRIPAPKDGKDGLGFDDLSVTQVTERGAVIEFRRGDQVKSFPLRIPGFIDRKIYREELAYEQGDAVTRGGSLWIAQRDVAPGEVPGREEAGAWRLAVKKGADGPKGERGEPGSNGANGKDGRNYDGSRG